MPLNIVCVSFCRVSASVLKDRIAPAVLRIPLSAAGGTTPLTTAVGACAMVSSIFLPILANRSRKAVPVATLTSLAPFVTAASVL